MSRLKEHFHYFHIDFSKLCVVPLSELFQALSLVPVSVSYTKLQLNSQVLTLYKVHIKVEKKAQVCGNFFLDAFPYYILICISKFLSVDQTFYFFALLIYLSKI